MLFTLNVGLHVQIGKGFCLLNIKYKIFFPPEVNGLPLLPHRTLMNSTLYNMPRHTDLSSKIIHSFYAQYLLKG